MTKTNDETKAADRKTSFRHSVIRYWSLIRHSNFVIRHSHPAHSYNRHDAPATSPPSPAGRSTSLSSAGGSSGRESPRRLPARLRVALVDRADFAAGTSSASSNSSTAASATSNKTHSVLSPKPAANDESSKRSPPALSSRCRSCFRLRPRPAPAAENANRHDAVRPG